MSLYFIILLIFALLVLIICTLKVNINNTPFIKHLTISKKRLKLSVNYFNDCIKSKTIIKCMKKNDEIYSFTKVTTTNNIINFRNGIGNYRVLLYPKTYENVINLVIVPVAPTELIARIAVRSTWQSIKQTDNGKKLKYMFYMGKPETKNNSYPISFLYDEAKKYNDILLFDIENSYIKSTLLLLLCYRYVANNFNELNYLIRVNSDMIFYPQKLDKMLDINEDVIGYKTEQIGIEYLSGSFYIIKKNYIKLVIKESKNVIPLTFYDDIYFGQINKEVKFNRIAYINKDNYYIPLDETNQNMLFNKSSQIIGAHSVNSNAILFFWLYNGYEINY